MNKEHFKLKKKKIRGVCHKSHFFANNQNFIEFLKTSILFPAYPDFQKQKRFFFNELFLNTGYMFARTYYAHLHVHRFL